MYNFLYVNKSSQKSLVAKSFIKTFEKQQKPIFFVEGEEEIAPNLNPKENLFLTHRKGGFVNACPCSPQVICCGYHNINLAEGCPFTCNYCALDVYLNFPTTKIFTNLSDFETELDAWIKNHQEVRIGTGELSDSLIWEPYFNYSGYLMNLFKKYPKSILEFKTKSVFIENLLNQEPTPNTLISWSMNTPHIIAQEEKNTPSLEERFLAANKLVKKGYKVGFHFDPIYYYPNWQEDYGQVLEKLCQKFSPQNIGWISLGVIRFHPDLKEILYNRGSLIMDMELFPAFNDGKMRLFYDLRQEVMQFFLKNLSPFKQGLYFCMEPNFMWQECGLCYQKINQRLFSFSQKS